MERRKETEGFKKSGLGVQLTLLSFSLTVDKIMRQLTECFDEGTVTVNVMVRSKDDNRVIVFCGEDTDTERMAEALKSIDDEMDVFAGTTSDMAECMLGKEKKEECEEPFKRSLFAQKVKDWQHGDTHSFPSHVFSLIMKSDRSNRAKMAQAFPELYSIWLEWYESNTPEEFYQKHGV